MDVPLMSGAVSLGYELLEADSATEVPFVLMVLDVRLLGVSGHWIRGEKWEDKRSYCRLDSF